MKRGRLVTVKVTAWNRSFGSCTTSSASAIRETLHEGLDVWIDELLEDLARSGVERGPLDQLQIEVHR